MFRWHSIQTTTKRRLLRAVRKFRRRPIFRENRRPAIRGENPGQFPQQQVARGGPTLRTGKFDAAGGQRTKGKVKSAATLSVEIISRLFYS